VQHVDAFGARGQAQVLQGVLHQVTDGIDVLVHKLQHITLAQNAVALLDVEATLCSDDTAVHTIRKVVDGAGQLSTLVEAVELATLHTTHKVQLGHSSAIQKVLRWEEERRGEV
jgi:hypothetical protein